MSQPDTGLSRLGAFALEERLGYPPAQSVYRGVHVERRQSFAIRVLPAEVLRGPLAERTFKEEVAALKELVHPHIVRCYGGSIDHGRPFLALELIPGESVAEQLARRGRLTWESAVAIAEQLCQALAFAHGRGVLHERLVPEKVLLDELGNVHLGGFGSVWADRYTGRSPASLPPEKARYLAPEQLAGDLPVTARSDLYGLGSVLFAMVTGQAPFTEATTTEELLRAKRSAEPPRVSAYEFNAPVWLDLLVAKLLQPVPTDRFASAQDVLNAVAEARRNVESGVSTAQRALASRSAALLPAADRAELERIRKKKVRKKNDSPFYERAWFLAACLALVVAGITWALWPASEEELYRQAAALMASEDSVDWYRARDNYLVPLKQRFPHGKYADQVQKWFEQIEMDQAEARVQRHVRFGTSPTNEAERLYAEAWRYEQFGDRITALSQYRGLESLLADSPDDANRPVLNLARRRIAEITSGGADQSTKREFDRAEFLRDRLDQAEELFKTGKTVEARRIWESTISLYGNNRELEPLVDEARNKVAE